MKAVDQAAGRAQAAGAVTAWCSCMRPTRRLVDSRALYPAAFAGAESIQDKMLKLRISNHYQGSTFP